MMCTISIQIRAGRIIFFPLPKGTPPTLHCTFQFITRFPILQLKNKIFLFLCGVKKKLKQEFKKLIPATPQFWWLYREPLKLFIILFTESFCCEKYNTLVFFPCPRKVDVSSILMACALYIPIMAPLPILADINEPIGS